MNLTRKQTKSKEWLLPAGLLLLSAIPVLAGAARMVELTGGAAITPDNARFMASPIPVIVHIISVTLYSILGAFQFAPEFRRRNLKWHRSVGRILVVSGIAAALSGLWMSQFYPLPAGDGELLYVLRLLFGSGMLLSIILGGLAAWRRDYQSHGAWMIRGYAIGLGAGTQVLTHIPSLLVFGVPGEFARAILMAAGWVINLAVAEWAIRNRRTRRPTARRPSLAAIPEA